MDGMKPYNEQLATARRWDKAVDAGSPITAQKLDKLARFRVNGKGSYTESAANARATEIFNQTGVFVAVERIK